MGASSVQTTDDDFPGASWIFDERPAPKSPLLAALVGLGLLAFGSAMVVASWGFPEATFPYPAAVGYLLTPLGTAIALAWALSRHRVASSSDEYNMARGRTILRLAIAVAMVGFVVGSLLTYRLAVWTAQLPVFTGGSP